MSEPSLTNRTNGADAIPSADEPLGPLSNGLYDLRVHTARFFPHLLIGTSAVAGIMILAAVWRSNSAIKVEDRIIVDLVQIRYLGILLGFIAMLFGIMMTWLGIASAFSLQGSAGSHNPATIALAGSSPGMFFALLGTVVTLLAIHKDVHYIDSGRSVPSDIRTDSSNSEILDVIKRSPLSAEKPEIRIWGNKPD